MIRLNFVRLSIDLKTPDNKMNRVGRFDRPTFLSIKPKTPDNKKNGVGRFDKKTICWSDHPTRENTTSRKETSTPTNGHPKTPGPEKMFQFQGSPLLQQLNSHSKKIPPLVQPPLIIFGVGEDHLESTSKATRTDKGGASSGHISDVKWEDDVVCVATYTPESNTTQWEITYD